MSKESRMYPETRLMTIEEAQRLSTLEGCELHRREQDERKRIWSWQTVDDVLSLTVSDDQLDDLAKR